MWSFAASIEPIRVFAATPDRNDHLFIVQKALKPISLARKDRCFNKNATGVTASKF